MKRLVTIALMTLLTACAGAGSEVRPAVCDWLRAYSRDFQARAAGELEALKTPSALRTMIEDYGELRARIRAVC